MGKCDGIEYYSYFQLYKPDATPRTMHMKLCNFEWKKCARRFSLCNTQQEDGEKEREVIGVVNRV